MKKKEENADTKKANPKKRQNEDVKITSLFPIKNHSLFLMPNQPKFLKLYVK